jgi:hypothetical protein
MTKFNLAALGASSAIALLFAAGAANALPVNTITLTGTVPQTCSLAANTDSGATGIALQTSATALDVGSVDETCNDDSGYSVSMTTTNGATGGLFETGSGDTAHQLAYTVTYGGVAASPIAGVATVTDVDAAVGGTGVVNKPITIAYTGASAALSAAADYTDTLTFAMTAK